MHELRLFEMLVGQGAVVVTDYDFQLGKNHLRGKGWRGIIALTILLIFLAMIVATLAISASPTSVWLVQLLKRVLAT
jgi:hypothetical protein